ncbi:MAG: hypothetical protein E6I52_14475 [Chloroflexi bacterium]|nr:MAG: hypothetical protein E6I52_14475 [Chloroflexota bacterium]
MKRGFRVIDSDLHLMEPHDLWQRHLPEPFRSRTRFTSAPTLGGGSRVEYGNGVAFDSNTSEIRGLTKRHTERRMAAEPRLALAARNCAPDADYPHHDSPWPKGVDTFLRLDGLGDESRRKILWDNGAALYGLGASEPATARR